MVCCSLLCNLARTQSSPLLPLHCRHPSLRTLGERLSLVQVGCSPFSGCCHLFSDLSSTIKDRSWARPFQRGVEREVKRLVLLFTHWVQASGVHFAPSIPHEYWRWPDHTAVQANFKKEM